MGELFRSGFVQDVAAIVHLRHAQRNRLCGALKRIAQINLTYTRVQAPIAGQAGLKQADLGNNITPGGIYMIDDMLPQANWPDGRAEKATQLIAALDARTDVTLSKIGWASGIIILVKK